MSETKLNSVLIDGVGTYSQGEFDRVRISGVGKFTGDVTCNVMEISGKGKVEGNLIAKEVKIAGKGKVKGDMTTDKLEVSGMSTCYGAVSAKEVKITGYSNGAKRIKSHTIKGSGFLKADKEISSELLDMSGILDCEGTVNCEELRLTLFGTSEVKEIGGSIIHIKSGTSMPSFLRQYLSPSKFKLNKLVVDTVEGDIIYLENCVAKTVRGKKVTLGKHCDVESVEYEETFDKDDTATVKTVNETEFAEQKDEMTSGDGAGPDTENQQTTSEQEDHQDKE